MEVARPENPRAHVSPERLTVSKDFGTGQDRSALKLLTHYDPGETLLPQAPREELQASSLSNDFVEGVGNLVLTVREQVAVAVERYRNAAVAELVGDLLRVGPLRGGQGGAGV